jgi:hypothetical protein
VFPVRYELNLYILFRRILPTECVPYGSHNKQRLFPQTALTGWALQWRRNVFSVRYELNLYILFRRILPTECICVFRMALTINSDCFPKQH